MWKLVWLKISWNRRILFKSAKSLILTEKSNTPRIDFETLSNFYHNSSESNFCKITFFIIKNSRIKGRFAAHARGATAPLMYYSSGLTSTHLLHIQGTLEAIEWLSWAFFCQFYDCHKQGTHLEKDWQMEHWDLSKKVHHTMMACKNLLWVPFTTSVLTRLKILRILIFRM